MDRLSFKDYLILEETFKIDDVVDYIYKKYFSDWFKIVDNHTSDKILPVPKRSQFRSTDLEQFDIIKKANETNPVTITTNFLDGNAYSPQRQLVRLSINKNLVDFIQNNRFVIADNVMNLADILPKNKIAGFKNDINGKKVKSSIAHEIAHWLDDTFHNSFIRKVLDRASSADDGNNEYIVRQGFDNVALTNFEIQAQIHQIKELKKNTDKKVWNTISFIDMISMDISLLHIEGSLGRDEKKLWHKILLRRMVREKLIGRKMR